MGEILRKLQDKKPYTRKQFIRDCVKSYIKNNPEEYATFLNHLALRRNKMVDKKFGSLNKGGKPDEDTFRAAFSIPTKLYSSINTILHHDDHGILGNVRGELKWFSKEFPQFLIPSKY